MYQKNSCVCPLGTVKVCMRLESVDGEVEPIWAAPAPPCTGLLTANVVPAGQAGLEAAVGDPASAGTGDPQT